MTGGPTAMTAFQEFLRRKAPAEFEPTLRRERDEWLAALRTLRETLKGWVKELDPDGYLALRDRDYPRLDRRLGRYDAPGLEIGLAVYRAEVEPTTHQRPKAATGVPLGRRPDPSWSLDSASLGEWKGLVLLHGTSGVTHGLHLFQPGVGDAIWVLEDRPPGNGVGSITPFDREQFAMVLQELLA